ncbi:MAG: histidine--tRNA ligase [Candidatus Eisenbacteria bacterium]|uniref:Histidine--tRNA ligase n=1 Tax=Eiseniibacteriota bacterium TaxID=2212470 RepID=A0A933SEH9_UNCEI|nr:histidine--tRNA ligase [Candidatus Eisenbacteria bacterium]
MAPKHQAPRGTRDLLPADTALWRWAEDAARGVLGRYGFGELRTPIFEDYELFARTAGESSDVVQKEMYKFRDLGERDLALRPEFTAGVLRAYLEHGLGGRSRVHRLWSTGPVFRYGRPQKGRYRQFHQLNCELIGSSAPGADVEMITLFVDLYEAWGFSDLTVLVNSVGQPASRRAYGERLREWLAPVHDRLSADSQARLVTNPLRVLDTKDTGDHALFAELGNMPHLLDVIDEADRAHWDAVIAGLEAAGVKYEIDHGLVRGLDYYSRTAFEVHDRSLGAQSALGGGGRYDGLVEMLGGAPTPGVGFAVGLDRALLVLEERGIKAGAPDSVCLVTMDGTRAAAIALARELRREFVVECDVEARGFGAQMKSAGKSGARFLVIMGEDEWRRGEVALKDSKSGTQEVLAREALAGALRAKARATGETA